MKRSKKSYLHNMITAMTLGLITFKEFGEKLGGGYISIRGINETIPGDVSDREYSPYGKKQRQSKIQKRRYSKVVASYSHPNPTEWLLNH